MSLNIYLTFDGNCREAFDFYKSVFGGDFMAISTFADAPPDMKIADAEKGRIMHVSLPVGTSTLMGSDSATGFGPPLKPGNNFSISVVGESRAHCDSVIDKLANGGEVTYPVQDTFWGSYFGMCRDRFGITWMVNYDTGNTTGK